MASIYNQYYNISVDLYPLVLILYRPPRLNRANVSVYHAVPREETETVDFDQDGRSRVAVSFRMNGVESTSADV